MNNGIQTSRNHILILFYEVINNNFQKIILIGLKNAFNLSLER